MPASPGGLGKMSVLNVNRNIEAYRLCPPLAFVASPPPISVTMASSLFPTLSTAAFVA